MLQVLYGNPGVTPPDVTINLPKVPVGPLAQIPVLGPAIDGQSPLVWVAFASVGLYSFMLDKTRFGVHLRAVGEDEGAAEAAGINVRRLKLYSVLISGAMCGLAGAQLAMATLGAFTSDLTAGRGFIAVAALTFGLARPVPTMVAAIIFGAADSIADQLGIAGLNSNLALMTPYIITVLALILVGIRLRRAVAARPDPDRAVSTTAV